MKNICNNCRTFNEFLNVMTIDRGPMLFDMPLIAVLGYLVTFILGLIGIVNYLYSR